MSTVSVYRRFLCSLALMSFLMPVGIAGPIDLFLFRLQAGRVKFLGFDPADVGNPNKATTLAHISDSDGSLGLVTVQSPGFWRSFVKGAVITASSIGGAFAGAAAGAPLAGVGAIPGAIIGGSTAYVASAGTMYLANSGSSNPYMCLDVAIYDQLMIENKQGNRTDLLAAIVDAVPEGTARIYSLPGGAVLLRPQGGFISGGYLSRLDRISSSGEIELAVIDVDGDLSTKKDRVVAVFMQDLIHGFGTDDSAGIPLDGIVNKTLLSDGDKIISRHILAASWNDGFSAVATVEPHSIVVGQTGVVSVGITNTTEYLLDKQLIVGVEIYNSAGRRVFQDFVKNQPFSANQSRSFAFAWIPDSADKFLVKVAVFNSDASVTLHREEQALAIEVKRSDINVIWPKDGTILSPTREHMFSAVIPGRSTSSYSMWWYLDSDERNLHTMKTDTPAGFQKTDSVVDVKGWTRRDNGPGKPYGPYKITFLGRDGIGVGTTREVEVFVDRE